MNTEFTYPYPELFITVTKQEDKWIAFGSRKVNYFSIENKVDYDDITTRTAFSYSSTYVSEIVSGCSMQGCIVVEGYSPLAAIGALLDAFREEEKQELIEEESRKIRNADIKRFGGEVNEELVRKVVRWRKKQAKKAADVDPYDEYLYDEDY